MQTIKIRRVCKEDLERIYEIEKSSFSIPWSIESIEQELNNILAESLVAEIDNLVVRLYRSLVYHG